MLFLQNRARARTSSVNIGESRIDDTLSQAAHVYIYVGMCRIEQKSNFSSVTTAQSCAGWWKNQVPLAHIKARWEARKLNRQFPRGKRTSPVWSKRGVEWGRVVTSKFSESWALYRDAYSESGKRKCEHERARARHSWRVEQIYPNPENRREREREKGEKQWTIFQLG